MAEQTSLDLYNQARNDVKTMDGNYEKNRLSFTRQGKEFETMRQNLIEKKRAWAVKIAEAILKEMKPGNIYASPFLHEVKREVNKNSPKIYFLDASSLILAVTDSVDKIAEQDCLKLFETPVSYVNSSKVSQELQTLKSRFQSPSTRNEPDASEQGKALSAATVEAQDEWALESSILKDLHSIQQSLRNYLQNSKALRDRDAFSEKVDKVDWAIHKLESISDRIIPALAKRQIALWDVIMKNYDWHKKQADASCDENYQKAVKNCLDYCRMIENELSLLGVEAFESHSGDELDSNIHKIIGPKPADNYPLIEKSLRKGFRYKDTGVVILPEWVSVQSQKRA